MEEYVTCKQCGATNEVNNDYCWLCGERLIE